MSEEGNKGDPALGNTDKMSVSRILLSDSEKGSLSCDEWAQKWLTMESYVDHLEERITSLEAELTSAKAAEEKHKLQNSDAQQRERILIRRIATKDQEIQDCMNQIAELKAAQAPGASALRAALLDPAVNLLLHRLRQEVTSLKTKLEETQNELSAWKFTPDSNTGKRLMAKCRLLYQENEELGRIVSSGRLAKLEGDLALQKNFSEEFKNSQSDMDEFLQDLDEDVEGMQGTIYFLQQELKKTKEALAELQNEKTSLKSIPSGNASPLTTMESNVKSEEPREPSRTGSGSDEFRTGNPPDRLTNGNHSVLCGGRTTNSNKVLDPPASTDNTKKVKKSKRTNHEDSDSDSSEVLKFEEEDLCEEVDKEVNCHRVERTGRTERTDVQARLRKRTFRAQSEETSNDSDNVPLMKKGRRGSELSLDYNEDELCLTNGEIKTEDR